MITQLAPYLNEAFYNREKVVYLNKKGRDLIGSTREITKSAQLEHHLLRNEVYLYYGCPPDWKTEHTLEIENKPARRVDYVVKGLTPATKIKAVCDAYFKRNAVSYVIEVDNTRDMADNKRKVKLYAEILRSMPGHTLVYFTKTTERKSKLTEWVNGTGTVLTFDEIR